MARVSGIKRRFLLAVIVFVFTIILLDTLIPKQKLPQVSFLAHEDEREVMSTAISNNYTQEWWRVLDAEEQGNLSTLGRILYMGANPPPKTTRTYTILMWKYGLQLELRHINRYTERKYDPFENCMVRNCHIKYSPTALSSADIVVFDLYRTKTLQELPLDQHRNPKQIWAFLIENSPLNIFKSPQQVKLSNFNSLFNWSMTYSMVSDIPIPYGRTEVLANGQKGVLKSYEEWNQNKKQDVLLAIVGSTCQSHNRRWEYVGELKKLMKIDIYGNCGNKRCRSDESNSDSLSNFANDCQEISQYKFYLAFENANCDQYLTEKVWWYGYKKNAIPVVMGGLSSSYEHLLPPYSYLNVEDFAKPRDLANYIMYLNRTPSDIRGFFEWKKYFKVVNEHGYFHTKSAHYCRICEALNYNGRETKVYDDLEKFWSVGKCTSDWSYLD